MQFEAVEVDEVGDEGEVRTVEMHPNRCSPILRVLLQEGGDVLVEEFGLQLLFGSKMDGIVLIILDIEPRTYLPFEALAEVPR